MGKYNSKIALLGGVIDYAGTFPPAALPLDQAIGVAAKFRQAGKHSWLMGRMTLPLSDLKKINATALFNEGADGGPWLFTSLGSTPEKKGWQDFERTVEWDLREIRRWNDRAFYAPVRHKIVGYEIKIAEDGYKPSAANELIPTVMDRFVTLTSSQVDPFFELEPDSLKGGCTPVLDALTEWVSDQDERTLIPGVKVRTGGKTPPKVSELAQVLSAITSRGLRFKATQGLHSAVTHEDSFGFVNLFGAITFAQSLGNQEFGPALIEKCLKDSDPKHFMFTDKKFSWNDFELDIESIEGARRIHSGTFGSCSLDEPDDSLAKEFG